MMSTLVDSSSCSGGGGFFFTTGYNNGGGLRWKDGYSDRQQQVSGELLRRSSLEAFSSVITRVDSLLFLRLLFLRSDLRLVVLRSGVCQSIKRLLRRSGSLGNSIVQFSGVMYNTSGICGGWQWVKNFKIKIMNS